MTVFALRILTASVLGAFLSLASSAQYEFVLDSVSTTDSSFWKETVLTSDMAQITVEGGIWGAQVRKYDANGLPVWGRWLTQGARIHGFSELKADQNGGVVFALISDVDQIGFADDPHITIISITLVHLDLNGALLGATTVERTINVPPPTWFWPYSIRLHLDANDAPRVVMSLSSNYVKSLDLIRFDTQHNFVWAKSVGVPITMPTVPTEIVEFLHGDQFTASKDDGSVVIGIGHPTGGLGGDSDVYRVDGDGNLLWGKSYTMTNNVIQSYGRSFAWDAAGTIHLHGELLNSTGAYLTSYELGANGSVVTADLYRVLYSYPAEASVVSVSGRRFILPEAYNALLPVAHPTLLSIPSNGTPAWLGYRKNNYIGSDLRFVVERSMDIRGDQLVLSGYFVNVDQNFGFQSFRPSIARYNIEELSNCAMVDTLLERIVVPPSVINVTTIPNATTMDISQYYSTGANTFTISSLQNPEMEDLCSLVIGLEENEGRATVPLLRSNLIEAGVPLQLRNSAWARVRIFDANGSLVVDGSTATDQGLIPTDGWVAGLYVVHVMDRSGKSMGAERFVVE